MNGFQRFWLGWLDCTILLLINFLHRVEYLKKLYLAIFLYKKQERLFPQTSPSPALKMSSIEQT